jgi:NTE family protein
MAASIAMSKSTTNAIGYVKDAIKHKPSADISFFPLISLVKGGNIKRMVEQTIESFSGDPNLDMSDTWLPMYGVASNLTVAEATSFSRGPLGKVLLASSAVPGVFPPVIIDGEIYVDGGSFNNFPVDVMHNLKMNKVIGVDFVIEKSRKVSLSEMPSNKEVLRGKLLGGKAKTRVPSISSIILNSTLLYSNAKRKEVKSLLDLHFNPNVSKFKFTCWNDFDKIVEAGYRNAKEILGAMSKEELDSFRDVQPD